METNKPVLALETSGDICGVCLYFSDKKYSESVLKMKNIHSEKLLSLVDSVLKLTDTSLSEVGAIAVSSGPGSFTGLRIGMSTAKGLAFGSSLPIIPVPTFDALAFQINGFLRNNTEFIIANKVNVEEVYYASYRSRKDLLPECVEKLKILQKKDIEDIVGTNNYIYGSAFPDSVVSCPSPLYIAKWAALNGSSLETFDYDYLEPFYLKNFVAKKN